MTRSHGCSNIRELSDIRTALLRFKLPETAFFYYEGNIVRSLQRRYDGITRKSTAESLIAGGDFLIM